SDTTTPALYTLSLHDALPIFQQLRPVPALLVGRVDCQMPKIRIWREINNRKTNHPSVSDVQEDVRGPQHGAKISRTRPLRSIKTDRKSTRLNSSHRTISYAVF